MGRSERTSLTVLLTCVGGMPSPAMIECLRDIPEVGRVIGADMDIDAVGKYHCDAFYTVPNGQEAQYIPAVQRVCIDAGVDAIVPCSDEEAMSLAQARKVLAKQNVKVVCPSLKATQTACDKAETLRTVAEAGVKVPAFGAPATPTNVEEVAQELGYPDKSLIAKPRFGRGGCGVWLLTPKPNLQRNELRLEWFCQGMTRHDVNRWVLMEYLPGNDYTVEFVADSGNMLLAVAHHRLKTAGSTVKGRTVLDRDVYDYARQVVKALGLHSLANLQVKRSTDGEPLLYEVNPRCGATITLAAEAGVDLLRYAIRQACGLPIPTNLEPEIVTLTRLWAEDYERDGDIAFVPYH